MEQHFTTRASFVSSGHNKSSIGQSETRKLSNFNQYRLGELLDDKLSTTTMKSKVSSFVISGRHSTFSHKEADLHMKDSYDIPKRLRFSQNQDIFSAQMSHRGTDGSILSGLSKNDVKRDLNMKAKKLLSRDSFDSSCEEDDISSGCLQSISSEGLSWALEEKLSCSKEQHDGATGGRKVTLPEALDMKCTVIPTEQSQLRRKEVPKKIRKSTDAVTPSVFDNRMSLARQIPSLTFMLEEVWPWPWLDGSRESSEYRCTHAETFMRQKLLKKWEPPLLAHTLKGYLDSMEPCILKGQSDELRKILNEFALCKGKKLTEKLLTKIENSSNWLKVSLPNFDHTLSRQEQMFQNIPINVPLCDDLWPTRSNTQVKRAAEVISLTVDFFLLIFNKRLRPLKNSENEYLCMSSFRKLFSTSRIPCSKQDEIKTYFHTRDASKTTSDYIVVMYKSKFFPINVVDGDHARESSSLEMEIRRIKRSASSSVHTSHGLGILTSTDRDTWYERREKLIALDEHNRTCLDIIDRALFLVSLDDVVLHKSGLGHEAAFADGCNRWYDKSLSFYVYENGIVTCNVNISCQDGWAVAVLLDYIHLRVLEDEQRWDDDVLSNISKIISRPISTVVSPALSDSLVEEKLHKDSPFFNMVLNETHVIPFVLDQELKDDINSAIARFNELQERIEIVDFESSLFSGCKVQPEAFAHLVFHLTFFRMYYRMPSMGSRVQCKTIFQSRCDLLRATTREAHEWCKSMIDTGVSKKEKTKLFFAAAKKHMEIHQRGVHAQGYGNHVNALKIIANEAEEKLPSALNAEEKFDILVESLGTEFLATRVVLPNENCSLGIGYSLAKQKFCGFVSSFKECVTTSSVLFAASLKRTLEVYGDFFKDL